MFPLRDEIMKILIIGGHPKGYRKAFSPKTRSGKILHGLLDRHGIRAILMDLWKDEQQEKAGFISKHTLRKIHSKHVQGYRIIVVGRYMFNQLSRQLHRQFDIHYLPHPASRTRRDRLRLEAGLKNYAGLA
jgi:hypothetical protein